MVVLVLKLYVEDCEIQMLGNRFGNPTHKQCCGPIDKSHSFCDYVASFDNVLVLLRIIRFGFNHGWFDSDDEACSSDICRTLGGF